MDVLNAMNHEPFRRIVAILVADGFEESEMTEPKRALDAAGVRTVIVTLKPGTVKAWSHDHYGDCYPVDTTVEESAVEDFDALLLPGGVLSSDTLRASKAAVRFVRGFFRAGKPVAAICHGSQTMIDAGVVRNRTLTSFPSMRADLQNAGANWVDAAVVIDHGLVTSRSQGDLQHFTATVLAEFVEGRSPDYRAHAFWV